MLDIPAPVQAPTTLRPSGAQMTACSYRDIPTIALAYPGGPMKPIMPSQRNNHQPSETTAFNMFNGHLRSPSPAIAACLTHRN